jgi:hypothetical protein
MTEIDPSRIPWREPWYALREDWARKAEAELRREVCSEHALFDRNAIAIGQRQDCDDFLFFLGDTPPSYAVVHLTYQHETRPDWPQTEFFDSLDDWITKGLGPDADDFAC